MNVNANEVLLMFKIFSYLLGDGQSEFPDLIDKFAGSRWLFLVLFSWPKTAKLPKHSLKGCVVVLPHVYNHVKNFGDVDEGQSELPDSIDEYKRTKLLFLVLFSLPKMAKLPKRSQKGCVVIPLHFYNHIKNFRNVDGGQSEFLD